MRSIRNLGATKWWAVSIKFRPLCPRERPDTHCTGSWVGLGSALDGHEKHRPHRNVTAIETKLFRLPVVVVVVVL